MDHLSCRFVLIGVIAGLVSAHTAAGDLDDLDWIAGDWKRESRRGEVYESWQRLSDRTVEGRSWVVTDDGARHRLESLLLVEMEGELFYIPKVAENEYPTPFRMTSKTDDRVVFENPNHDFPQKIVYQRDGDAGLLVTIEGPAQGGEPHRIDFHFHRTDHPRRPE